MYPLNLSDESRGWVWEGSPSCSCYVLAVRKAGRVFYKI